MRYRFGKYDMEFLYSDPLYACLNPPFQWWVQKNYVAQNVMNKKEDEEDG